MENVEMIEKLKQEYNGRKVFITGHTGFKGSWMLGVLKHLGAEVKGFALEPDGDPSLYKLINGDKLCQSVIADIRNKERLTKEIIAFQPDFIFHLAAQSLVRVSYDKPADTYDINVMGTTYLLDAIRGLDKECSVVVVTTDKVYENRETWDAYKETEPLGGFDPYSSSKACAEIVTASYRRSFFPPQMNGYHRKGIASARAGNVIGGGDWAKDRIIPDLIRAINANNVLTVRNPESVRPWQHVLEPVCGYLWLGAQLLEDPAKFATAFNFGPMKEDNLSVKELVEKSLGILGQGSYKEQIEPNAPHEAKILRLDISKAIFDLGWKPKWNSGKALEMTLDWYKEYPEGALDIMEKQIVEFLNA
jgi:CDP-glucose 4,6-dehydratase